MRFRLNWTPGGPYLFTGGGDRRIFMYRIPTFLSYTLESADKKAPAPIRSFGAGRPSIQPCSLSNSCRPCAAWSDPVHGSDERLRCCRRIGLQGSPVEGDLVHQSLPLRIVKPARSTARPVHRLIGSTRVTQGPYGALR
eukprot:748537-Hanusia_phi.AAC.2